MSVKIRYLLHRPEGYYYQRKIPKDLLQHYSSLPNGKIRVSLKTDELKVAIRHLKLLNDKYENDFRSLRLTGGNARETTAKAQALLSTLDISNGQLGSDDEISSWLAAEALEDYYTKKYGNDYLEARHNIPSNLSGDEASRYIDDELKLILDPADQKLFELANGNSRSELFFSEARDLYLQYKEKGSDPDFIKDTNYSCDVFLSLFGDLPISSITREHANRYMDHLLTIRKNKTTSARRRIDKINAVMNKAITVKSLTIINPFRNLEIPKYKSDAKRREDFTLSELELIAKRCQSEPTSALLVIAMLINTGARIGEIAGLRVRDVFIEVPTPYIYINAEERSIKTEVSERYVPLVGVSLWAAKVAVTRSGSKWLFPSYVENGKVKSRTISASCSKWTKKITNTQKTPHSFRHTLNGKFKDLEVSEEIRDAIFGWGSKKQSRHYGRPHSIDTCVKYLEQAKV